jgi:hypothetical protein
MQDQPKKSSTTSASKIASTPVFPQTLHRQRATSGTAPVKPKKRDNIFSKSRDTREDRGTREMKTSHNDQTFHSR